MGKAVPLITAIISAITILTGYMYQKHEEREAEIRKTRQEIYSHLIINFTDRIELLNQIQQSSDWQNAKNYQEQYQIAMQRPELSKNIKEQRKIATFLSLYGTDDAIQAYANFLKEGWDNNSQCAQNADWGKLIQGLRKSIYPNSDISSDDINLVIWNDIQHLNRKSPAAK